MSKKILSVIFLCLVASFLSRAQTPQKERISGIFAGLEFERFAEMVENKTSYRFFFKTEDVKGIVVNLNAYDSPIGNLLREILKPEEIFFTIDPEQRIFLSKQKRLEIGLPADFFQIQQENVEPNEIEASLSENANQDFAKNRLWEVGNAGANPTKTNAILKGIVKSAESDEPIIGALVYTSEQEAKSITDESGQYEITLPRGRHTADFSKLRGLSGNSAQIIFWGMDS